MARDYVPRWEWILSSWQGTLSHTHTKRLPWVALHISIFCQILRIDSLVQWGSRCTHNTGKNTNSQITPCKSAPLFPSDKYGSFSGVWICCHSWDSPPPHLVRNGILVSFNITYLGPVFHKEPVEILVSHKWRKPFVGERLLRYSHLIPWLKISLIPGL